MEIVLTEEKAKELWDDSKFLEEIEGCKEVRVSVITELILDKFMAIRPTSVTFGDQVVSCSEKRSNDLAIFTEVGLSSVGKEE